MKPDKVFPASRELILGEFWTRILKCVVALLLGILIVWIWLYETNYLISKILFVSFYGFCIVLLLLPQEVCEKYFVPKPIPQTERQVPTEKSNNDIPTDRAKKGH